jgi:hypothetical protein
LIEFRLFWPMVYVKGKRARLTVMVNQKLNYTKCENTA